MKKIINNKLPVIIGSALVIVILVASVFMFYNHNKKEKFISGLKQALYMDDYEELKDSDFMSIFKDDKYKIEYVLEVSTKEGEKSNIDIKLFNVLKQAYYDVNMTSNTNSDIEKLTVFKDNNRVYYRYDESDLAYYEDLIDEEVEIKDIEKLFDLLFDAIKDYLSFNNLKVENSSITLDSKKYNTKLYSISFTEKDLLKILKGYMKNISKDKELSKNFKSALVKNSLTEKQFFDELDVLIDSSSDDEKLFSIFEHFDGNDLLSIKIEFPFKSESGTNSITIEKTNYKNKNGFDNTEFNLYVMNIKCYSLEIIGTSKNRSEIYFKSLEDLFERKTVGFIQKDNGKYELKIDINGNSKCYIYVLIDEVIKGTKYNIDAEVELVSDNSNISLKQNIVVDNSNVEIPSFDTSNIAEFPIYIEEDIQV